MHKKRVDEKAIRIEDITNFMPKIEGYCKRGDLKNLKEFMDMEKALIPYMMQHIRGLMYKAIEGNHPQILKFLLTLPLNNKNTSENYNLLHIACRPKLAQKNDL